MNTPVCGQCVKWMNHHKDGCPREVYHSKLGDPLQGMWTGPSCASPACEDYKEKEEVLNESLSD